MVGALTQSYVKNRGSKIRLYKTLQSYTLLSGGQNISSNKWLRDLFFNEDSNIPPMIFHSQPWLDTQVW